MTDHTLPPEVERDLALLLYPALTCTEQDYRDKARERVRAHITTQAEEIERLREQVDSMPSAACVLATQKEADRYKAMAEWLAAGAWQNYCPEFPPQEIEGVGTVVGLVVEDEDCPLGIRTDDPEHCPKCWLKAAEEAVHTPCPLCGGRGREHDGDSYQQTPCACQEGR